MRNSAPTGPRIPPDTVVFPESSGLRPAPKRDKGAGNRIVRAELSSPGGRFPGGEPPGQSECERTSYAEQNGLIAPLPVQRPQRPPPAPRPAAPGPAPARGVPGPDPDPAAVLGRARLRHPPALRHGSRRGHVPSGDDAARARPEAVERRLRAALAPAQGWPLRREPEPPAALLPVPGDHEAVAGRHPGPLPAEPRRHRHRHARSTTSASSRTTGKARRSAPGASAGKSGATAWR